MKKKQCAIFKGHYLVIRPFYLTDSELDTDLFKITRANVTQDMPTMFSEDERSDFLTILEKQERDNPMLYWKPDGKGGEVQTEVPAKDLVWIDMDFTDETLKILKGAK